MLRLYLSYPASYALGLKLAPLSLVVTPKVGALGSRPSPSITLITLCDKEHNAWTSTTRTMSPFHSQQGSWNSLLLCICCPQTAVPRSPLSFLPTSPAGPIYVSSFPRTESPLLWLALTENIW